MANICLFAVTTSLPLRIASSTKIEGSGRAAYKLYHDVDIRIVHDLRRVTAEDTTRSIGAHLPLSISTTLSTRRSTPVASRTWSCSSCDQPVDARAYGAESQDGDTHYLVFSHGSPLYRRCRESPVSRWKRFW